MKDLNKRTEFEEQWEEVFQNAEITPPDGVWNKIDAVLSREEAGYFKKRAFMFKLLAAASVAFALGIGAFSLNYYLNQDRIESADSAPGQLHNPAAGLSDQGAFSFNSDNAVDASGDTENGNDILSNASDGVEFLNQKEPGANSGIASLTDPTNSASTDENQLLILLGEASESADQVVSNIQMTEQENLPVLASLGIGDHYFLEELYELEQMYRIPYMPRGASRKAASNDLGILTASLDFSAGAFSPNFQQGTGSFSPNNAFGFMDSRTELAAFNTANKDFLVMRSSGQETQPRVEYSYAGNIGFKISNRWLLQTGIAYRRSNTATYTSAYISDPETNARVPVLASYQYQLEGLAALNVIERTELNNQYEFAAIPLRLGYTLIDQKINVTLLAGISSEFFINNTIEDRNNYFQSLTIEDPAKSPFNEVYFNGSFGSMIGYNFAGNYLLTVEPGYRMALSSFTKDSFYLQSFPSSFMVTFGIAYNFK